MTRLHLTLLGGFRASLEAGPPLILPTRKAQALLAYLALPIGHDHPRDKVAALLWGDMREPQARGSLRQALAAIRRALAGVEVLRVDTETVALDPAKVAVDAVHFEESAKVGTLPALEHAAALYQGDLLAGLALNEAPFEEWLLGERERLRELALGVLARLVAQQRTAGSLEAAVQSALRLLALDPLQEPVHRVLMRLYAQLGRRGAALRQYQVCVAALERELHTEPESETKMLYQDILRRQPTGVGESSEPPNQPVPAPAPASRPIAAAPETPLVGRQGELAVVVEALDRSLAGDGRLVALLGEAGIGKSRLAEEIAAVAAGRGCQVMLGRCYETEQALPFAPWVDALRRVGVVDNHALVAELAPVWRAELARLLPEVGAGASTARIDGDPRSLFEAVVQVLHQLAGERPLVAAFEDLHWADEMSLRLLAFAGRRLAGRRILLVATARDEDLALAPLLAQTLGELERGQHVLPVRLAALSREDTLALTSRLVESGPMAAELAAIEEQVWRTSEGNPFVAVETVRALRHERGSRADHRAVLPSRVRDLIAERLARLGAPGRRLVAVAAVVGRQCDFTLLQRAAELPELEAARAMEELVRHRVLHQSGGGFEFTHDRIREVAQADLLAPHRLILHRRIAESLEVLQSGPRAADALALGTHYRAAEVWDKASRYLKEAGHMAWSRRAPADGAVCFEQALAALGRLAESRQTHEEAFEIHFALARVVYGLGDFSRALRHYRAAEDMARTLGDDRRLSQVLGGMLYLLSSEGLHGEASEMGERALALARTLDDQTLQVWTAVGLGRAYFALGQYRLGIERTRWLVAMDSQKPLGGAAWPAMLLPSVGSRTWVALCLAQIGEYGEALIAAGDAVSVAERAANAQARVWAYYTLAHIHVTRGESAPALALLERALPLCCNGEEPLYYPRVLGTLGSAHGLEGRLDQAVELLEHAVAESRAIRLLYGYAGLVTSLGEACLLAGQLDEASRLAAEAMALARERGERGDEGWALHLAAEIAARRNPPDFAEATAAYRRALSIAESLEMRPLAARCHLGLGALLGRAGGVSEARAQLARAGELFTALGIARWHREAEMLSADIAP